MTPAGPIRVALLIDTLRPAGAEKQLVTVATGLDRRRFATRVLVESAERLLEALEMSIDEIDLVVVHQANSRIIEHAAARLGIRPERALHLFDG